MNSPPAVTITSPSSGEAFDCPTSVDFVGKANDPRDGNISSAIVWSDNGVTFAAGAQPVKYYDCTTTGNHSIIASVTDSGGLTDTDSITISIVNPNIPAAPSNLIASLNGPSVVLRWRDNSNVETGFAVQRKAKGNDSWTSVATVAANVTTYSEMPGKGRWQYRVVAFNGNVFSSPSNVAGVTVK